MNRLSQTILLLIAHFVPEPKARFLRDVVCYARTGRLMSDDRDKTHTWTR